MGLTPRQCMLMMKAYGEERKELFLAFATMMGAKPIEGEAVPAVKSGSLSEYDMSKLDVVTADHVAKLKAKGKAS